MDLNNLYIGIDSGGTHCRVGLGDGKGKIIHSADYESVHYTQAGEEAFSGRISSVLSDFCRDINLELSSVYGICAGIAGARHNSDREKLRSALSDGLNFKNITAVSDTEVAYYSAFREDGGLLLISGTGSVLYGKKSGKEIRIGGWGKLLGDEGSSHSISLNLLKKAAASFDESDEATPLEIELKKKHGLSRDNLIREIYRGNFNIHSLTPFVIDMAERGNRMCAETLEQEAGGLIRLLKIFAGRFTADEKTEIAFLGSVIENGNFFERRLRARIKEEFGERFRIKEGKINTLKGALKIAVKTFSNED